MCAAHKHNELERILDQWVGHRILITKEEKDDIDQTVIDLKAYQHKVYEHSGDGYLPKAVYQLVGDGRTVDGGAPLPYDAFDIPVDDARELLCDPEGVFLRTDRALYTLTPLYH